MKASLAASAVLALACDRADLTSSQPFSSPIAAAVTPLPVVSVVASANDGNIPQNTLDNSLATRWSAYGNGQWIRYDLGSVVTIDGVDIGWYQGDTRSFYFDIEVSPDAATWTRVFSGHSSGQTVQLERYDLPTVSGRYLRIIGHGNNLLTGWTSITEIAISATPLSEPVVASANDGNIPQNTVDNSLATRWSAYGDGQWIRYDLGALIPVGRLDVAWYRGNDWASAFEIQVSPDAVTWTRVFAGRSSGRTLEPETYLFPVVFAQYVRIVGHGQWSATTQLSLWNSITEVEIDTSFSVVASANDGNVPQNTVDNSLATRWSAYGDGQWIRYDMGALMPVSRLDVAWYRGNEWASAFEIQVSPDADTWTKVFAGRSSGQTLEPETYLFPVVSTRYVRIVGHGQWSGTTQLSLWNSITEVEIDTSSTPPSDPGTVTDLAVVGATDTAATLAFTEANDGTGQPASYDVRFRVAPISWGSGLPSVTRGTCATPLAGSAIGARRTCTVLGLQPGTTYEFQLVAFRDTLTVDAVFGGLSNIAQATTALPTAPVASVSITPSSASVLLGATQQFTAVLKDANGNVLPGRSVTWASSNSLLAPVSSSGLVSGLVLGATTITATSEGESGSATITVTTSSGAPQPGPASTIILQDGFESGDLSLWTQSPNTGRYSLSTDGARVKSGARALEALYTPSNSYGIITRWFMPGYDEIYIKFYVMFEENFENPGMHFFTVCGNRVDNQSSCWGKAAQVPNGTDYFYAGIDPEYNPQYPILYPFHYYTYYPDMTCCYGNRSYQDSPKTSLVGGQWQEVVFLIKLNTPGQYDGSQTLWLNGVKKIDVQNMRWRDTYDVTLNEIRFDNYMAVGPSKTEHIWVDDVMVWRP
jgi:uncharacterized protein YjdB